MKVLCDFRCEIKKNYVRLLDIGLIHQDDDSFYMEHHVINFYKFLNEINPITQADKYAYWHFPLDR